VVDACVALLRFSPWKSLPSPSPPPLG